MRRTIALIPVLLLTCVLLPACNTAPVNVSTFRSLSSVAQRYDVAFVTAGNPFPVQGEDYELTGRAPDRAMVKAYAAMLGHEMSLYPANWFRRARIDRIVLCQELALDTQARAAVPAWDLNTYYLDVALGAKVPGYQRHAFHHDLYHAVDFRDDGLIYEDDAWAALNPPEFTYGSGGVNHRDMEDAWTLRSDLPGFVTRYATTGVEEDKAEVFAHLITNYDALMAICESDPVIAAKVQQLKTQLEAFAPEIDDRFWQRRRDIP